MDSGKVESFTKKQVAATLGVCVRSVERLIAMGKLVKVTVVRRAVRIPSWSLEAYMKEVGLDRVRVQARA